MLTILYLGYFLTRRSTTCEALGWVGHQHEARKRVLDTVSWHRGHT
jgi:hypothetical protein